MAQSCAVAEPGVNQPPWGGLLPWDAVVVVVLSRLLILPPGRLLCTQRPAAGMGELGTPCLAQTVPTPAVTGAPRATPSQGTCPGQGVQQGPPPPYLSGGTTTLGGLCRYCLKRSSKACPTVLMTLCASPSQHSRIWQAVDRQTDGLSVSLTLPSPPQDHPEPPLVLPMRDLILQPSPPSASLLHRALRRGGRCHLSG